VALAALAVGVLHAIERGSATPPRLTPAPAAVVRQVTSVSGPEQDVVGLPSSVAKPKVAGGQPALVLDGRPAAIFIGGEFCPLCASERWAIVMAFSRFGTFSGLKETTSSPWDQDPSTPTFSFYGASYTSRYVTLLMVERQGNDTSGPGTRRTLEPLTPLESTLWARYERAFRQVDSFPFLDVGNRVFVVSASYDPAVLAGLTSGEVATRLATPSAPAAADIIATSSYLTAAICSLTTERPVAVCSLSVIRQATRAMGLG